MPFEEGPHEIALKYDGEELPNSPLQVNAVYGSDPTRVKYVSKYKPFTIT